jgi:hypothetical protein
MEIAKDFLQGLEVGLRWMGVGGARSAQCRGNIGTRADCRVLKSTEKVGVDFLSHPGEGIEAMCARPERKPGSIGRDEDLHVDMSYLALFGPVQGNGAKARDRCNRRYFSCTFRYDFGYV